MAALRPAIRLALGNDPQTAGAINAERKLWEELDSLRIRILERHLRPYVSSVRKARTGMPLSLREDHVVRIECATRHLPENPLKAYGVQKHIDEAKAALLALGLVPENALTWLPDVMLYFEWLNK